MACGGSLFGRAFGYVVNQFLVEGLANNRAFQRFAVRTNRTFENLSSKAKEVKQDVSEKWRDVRGQDDVSYARTLSFQAVMLSTFLASIKLLAYEHERDSRIHGNVEYATKNYQLVLAKRDLEKRNLELHKQLGNALEYVAEVTTDDLELETEKRHKEEQELASMKEERKKMECSITTLLEEKKNLECHVARLNEENKKLEGSVATVKDEKRKVELYVADLLKLAHDHRAKIKKIAELCEE
ncbi:hypothetical protein ACQ4PT_061022 [Festuca glaucescens]